MLSKLEMEKLCDWTWGKLRDMEMLIEVTRAEAKETARSFCKEDATLTETLSCIGGECSVSPPKCPESAKVIGDVHTHPRGIGAFSSRDYLWALDQDLRIHCLGYPSKSKHLSREGDYDVKKNEIHCEMLYPDKPEVKEQMPRLMELLRQAETFADNMSEKARRGESYLPEYDAYKDRMKNFVKLAEETGLLKKCDCPTFMGRWQRAVERIPAKET